MNKVPRFALAHRRLANEPHVERLMGPDKIVLLNGFHEEETDYGPAVAVEDIDGLCAAVGHWLCGQTEHRTLTHLESRALRHALMAGVLRPRWTLADEVDDWEDDDADD